MLITLQQLIDMKLLDPQKITGALHVGAHQCEERESYDDSLHLGDDKVFWVEANPAIAAQARAAYPRANIYTALLADTCGKNVNFMVTNNGASSSMLELKTHKTEHPHVHETHRLQLVTETLEHFVGRVLEVKDPDALRKRCNFMNVDVQGAELLVLKGAGQMLQAFDHLYLEVNEKELYSNAVLLPELDAFLLAHGFERKVTEMTQHGWGDALYNRK